MDGSELVRISVLLFVVVLFIIFIVLDAWKAYSRKAHWVPSHFLVLSALIIQLLNLLSGKSALAEDAWEKGKLKKSELWMIHSGRLMLCVVMAYLLPSMAARGSQEFWGKIAALGITILGQMTSELFTVNSYVKGSLSTLFSMWEYQKDSNELLFIGSAVLLSITFFILILLLACANIASRGIQVIFAQKIPLILKEVKGEKEEWHTIENEVLKAWIVARAYTPEYIIARSALSASAGAVVSALIWISIIGWLYQSPTLKTDTASDKLKLLVTILQVSFILIGWVIVGWRWAIAAGYYTRWHKGTKRSVCKVEDYWTRHIKDLIEDTQPKILQAERLDKTVKELIAQPPTKITVPGILLMVVELVQWITVLFSKICWLVSLIIFHNKFTDKLVSLILRKHDQNEFEKFQNYEAILKDLDMLGETPQSLWIANKSSIAKAKDVITQGRLDGETSCKVLIDFLKKRKSTDGIDLTKFNPKNPPQFQYLWRALDKYKPLEVEKHFCEASKISWKMTAVSLIRIIIHLYPISDSSDCLDMQDCLNVYTQAWEILDFVDALEADGIMCEAADTFFLTLQKKVKKGDLPRNPSRIAEAIDEVAKEAEEKASNPSGLNIASAVINCLGLGAKTEEGKVEKPKTEGETEKPMPEEQKPDGQTEKPKDAEFVGAYDSMDWKKVAAGTTLYKLCKSIAPKPDANPDTPNPGPRELLRDLQCALADIVYGSIIKARSELVLKSRKWAKESDENRIGRALYTAGKAKTLMKMDKPERSKRVEEAEKKKAEEEKADKEKAEKEKRETNLTGAQQLQYLASGSEEHEIGPPDEYRLDIVPSTF
ncbi:hypothetical protein SUGI_0873260 [Cryptomeria japonica]|uniref:uncharacterized protein LOC131069313 n=1 Tax=Cryptomeria japonica TaxID=3369 RepID=UPI002414914C|nr:uncharacterized protein LOC131069313 [Cryptomeria japonica]GLJ42174.1 hypothetical protein SUGI_0873260 [Cryptomeria japonica]